MYVVAWFSVERISQFRRRRFVSARHELHDPHVETRTRKLCLLRNEYGARFHFINLSHSAQKWSAHNILSQALNVFFVRLTEKKSRTGYFLLLLPLSLNN